MSGLRVPTSAYEWRMSAYEWRTSASEYERAPSTRLPERFFVSARDDL
jgi:hypothetical protein